jgi:hypothetical protein
VYLDRSVGSLSLSAAAVMGVLAITAFSASGCNSRRLSGDGGAGVAGAAGRGGAAGDLAGAGAAGGIAGAVAGAGGAGAAGGGGGNAGASGWPVTLRLVNAGTSDVVLPELLDPTCGFSISAAAAAAGAGAAQPTSATPPDSWCDCDRCGATGRRLCDVSDPICNGAPTKLVAGGHLDVAWDGRVAVIGGPPPSASGCPINCDHWETVAAGSTTFTIETLSGSFTAEATLPSASGLVLLTINN